VIAGLPVELAAVIMPNASACSLVGAALRVERVKFDVSSKRQFAQHPLERPFDVRSTEMATKMATTPK
jgi:hypothetical protein